MVVCCGDVHTESRSADVGTVQAQGRLAVERERAFVDDDRECATFELAMSRLYVCPYAQCGWVERTQYGSITQYGSTGYIGMVVVV